jgi:hypothetical protein
MGMKILLLLATLLLPSQGSAEVLAIIKAPTQVNIGDLVVLDSSDSKGDNQKWVIDPRAEGRYLELERRIVFAIGTPGAYEFQLIVADTSAAIDQTKHIVTVGTVGGPPPGPIDPPKPPVDPPAPPTDNSVYDAVKAATTNINDPTTAQALRQALLSLPEKTPGAVQMKIAEVLLTRSAESQKKDWLNLWRKPVNDAIDKAQIPYEKAVEQIIKGLETSNVRSSSKLVVYTQPNCPPCEDWKRVELPKIEEYNWNVEWVEDPTKSTPSFKISHNGKLREYTGYMTYNTFCLLVASMKKE